MESADVAEAHRVLHELITKVERGELDASPFMLARLTGALDALGAITEHQTEHEHDQA